MMDMNLFSKIGKNNGEIDMCRNIFHHMKKTDA